ncbi:MAG TPA: glycoside hydrolase family 2 TIM barrel-domain containing protein [Verrucomicrobiae bacterium]|nr:glycoside hydrolase family 2 TIM barrel-domain containing protein [Verrucomicrobiae bacterium]
MSCQNLDFAARLRAHLFAALCVCVQLLAPQLRAGPHLAENQGGRVVVAFDSDWRFSRGDFANGMIANFNDSNWRQVEIPHDWSIEGPLGPEFASGSGFAPGGIGWYRNRFTMDLSASNKLVAIAFDGVYQNAQVWINGHLAGGRPYGYSSFECDLTPHLKFGRAGNVIAVRVDHTKFSDSRWYTGSGIYRHVRLRMTDRVRIAPWGTFVTTPALNSDSATVRIETELRNGNAADSNPTLQTEVVNPHGEVIASNATATQITAGTNRFVVQELQVTKPNLWSPDSPQLYTVRQRLVVQERLLDDNDTPFGFRNFRFDANRGFFLNEVPLKLKGVCLHHDAGALGAAVPAPVWERRLRTLKSIGVNAIRTSHNPPAPELLDLCDQMGFLVQDEALDEFTPPKNKWVEGWNAGEPSRFGAGEFFEQWAVRDVEDMVRRDRNHPSIIMWSIGNEIDYANDPFSHPVLGSEFRPDHPRAENIVKLARPLVAAVKRFDTTRPVTAALANVLMSDAVGFGEVLDIVGYNYQEQRYPEDHGKFPGRVIYGSENSHTWNAWVAVRENEFIAAQFLWTGVDYLGEAGRWPVHANGSGLLDLCGFKKPLAWFRQSLWSEKPMVYLCATPGGDTNRQGRGRLRADESWNWSSNSTVTVRCYTTCADVELTLNGKVIGRKSKAEAVDGALIWRVPFEPGTLKAAGFNGATAAAEFSLRTAGPAARVELLDDSGAAPISSSSRIRQVHFRIVDDQGVQVPDAAHEVNFAISGDARLLGIENGNLASTENYHDLKHRAYRGHGLLILKSPANADGIQISATAEGLSGTTLSMP